MSKLPQHIEERFDDYFPKLVNQDRLGIVIGNQIKSFIATMLEEERSKMIKEVEDVRNQYEHEVHGLNSVDSFNHALDHVVQSINLIEGIKS